MSLTFYLLVDGDHYFWRIASDFSVFDSPGRCFHYSGFDYRYCYSMVRVGSMRLAGASSPETANPLVERTSCSNFNGSYAVADFHYYRKYLFDGSNLNSFGSTF